jgi:hypothetical protein
MALTFSVVDTWDDGHRIHVSGTVAATGNYTTGGGTLDLSQVPRGLRLTSRGCVPGGDNLRHGDILRDFQEIAVDVANWKLVRRRWRQRTGWLNR